jgi:hypothetical protein
MKRVMAALVLAWVGSPAFAQIADPEIDALMKRWVAGFNKGDAAGLAREIYAGADEAALDRKFQELRADSFGKLDVYEFRACPVAGDKTRVQMMFARIYTFGGKMNDDEAKVFDLVKTPAGWRISGEADAAYGKELAC